MKYKLDEEEQEILDAFLNDKLERAENSEELIKSAKQAAKRTIEKFEKINLEIQSRDLYRLKIKSMETGVSYQNIISALIHNYVDNKIKVTL